VPSLPPVAVPSPAFANSTALSGRLAGDALVEDVRHAIPSYDAVILIEPKRADDEVLRGALAPLIGAIPSNPCGKQISCSTAIPTRRRSPTPFGSSPET
jgi:hypothetical protein